MSTTKQFIRITAADIKPGDQVTRSRTKPTADVIDIEPCASSVWLICRSPKGPDKHNPSGTYRIRPGYAIKFWKAV